MTVSIDGFDRVAASVRSSFSRLEADLREAVRDAAAEGVRAAQKEHPYQDHREPGKSYETAGAIGLTDTSHVEQPRAGSLRGGIEAQMVWPAPYAGFVNDGTSRSRPYPFTPLALERAEFALEVFVDRALERLVESIGG